MNEGLRRVLAGCALLAAVLLGACSKEGGFAPISVDSVVQAAVNTCKFQPTVDTVLNIIDAGVPGLSTAQLVAAAICTTINSPRAAGGQAPMVAGVKVEGKRL